MIKDNISFKITLFGDITYKRKTKEKAQAIGNQCLKKLLTIQKIW